MMLSDVCLSRTSGLSNVGTSSAVKFWGIGWDEYEQWRRSDVKYGARASQIKPSNCFGRLEKLDLPSSFDKSFILRDVKLAELSNNSLVYKRMQHFRGSRHTLTPPTYFQGD